MAQRFGGKYSPDGTPNAPGNYRGSNPTRAGARVNMMFIVPLPLIWTAFTSPPVQMAQYLGALALLLLAAWMTREGILAQEAYDARKVARRPGAPRKLFGSALTGLGLGLAGIAGFGVIEAIIFALLGAGLHAFSFGLDPMRDKGMDGIDQFQTDRVARAVDEAEKHLAAMTDAAKRAGDRGVADRVARFQAVVRDMLRTVEDDPRDLTAARKYMSVYLMGARDATMKFADIYARNQSTQAKSDYLMLLTDLEEQFGAKTKRLLLDDHSDLTVEIEVLRDRLQREGMRSD
ncbi:5-bromo-4-chloroindolyl phosphate hydrolysis family protein [Lutimaribacter sp. EGI FJ00015]|uniref:5-bromo-4-chloroindolyl phosphate hydrolysis family protein n=1 Tax=Lutimaribacter degradans TaxID=2945989 RepID=A0ACC5ZXB2_9RHOB|nr:5-bromo-4-chloroindolyl phosphate hydrolysis family protein [Lutimaribacter sp. EGI FJ00013]MCM2562692.1 5-bromo-4-chloroindolyl phosphate hydrolysis family protein [Lutimaribacter sp. EGI FJ00013]MCO0613849.1 5-bromo-4-chloroindolyl phosphate hydrolysis family protein [Lutimaribacter sp. EGI FJ00015]MCO0636668.1 5-bromo-4-chloroindolyl phosphate hydrolysis family protein [Lutimaribacter sp. EGI FJ00014]